MIDLAVFLKRNGYKPDQVQDFIPAPFDIATCMYHTGLDPFTGEEVYIAKHLRDRKMQRALLAVLQARELLRGARGAAQGGRRSDLIGSGCDCLIPDQPPKAARAARMAKAGRELAEGKYVHQIGRAALAQRAAAADATRAGEAGYRPHRKSSRRRPR